MVAMFCPCSRRAASVSECNHLVAGSRWATARPGPLWPVIAAMDAFDAAPADAITAAVISTDADR